MSLPPSEVGRKCHQLITTFLDTDTSFYPKSFTSSLLPSWSNELHQSVQSKVGQTFQDLVHVIRKHELQHLSLSYNGGKDCLILLVIYMAAIWEVYKDTQSWKINSVYIHTEPAFREQMAFLESSVKQFGLDFTIVYTYCPSPMSSINRDFAAILDDNFSLNNQQSPAVDLLSIDDIEQQQELQYANFNTLYSETHTLPSGFQTYLNSHKDIKAIIAGIRRTDPHAQHLKLEQPTDDARGWPSFIRINPVLEWNTAEVWTFVRWLSQVTKSKPIKRIGMPFSLPLVENFELTYCPLYDQGYTSLGGRHNTIKNPNLKKDNGNYYPAWGVVNDDIERLGRIQKGKV